MSITYKEIKARLTDLGFEEDDVTQDEYERIFINSLNRAGEIIYGTVMLAIEDYVRKQYDIKKVDMFGNSIPLPMITKITTETADADEIEILDILVPLYTLLAAHYAWLDDDLTKATIYWNEFDDLKNQIIANINRPRNAAIVGGIGW